ncbi:hypothetical protein VUR80DRAFT_2325 [Thermomyces stellatus]
MRRQFGTVYSIPRARAKKKRGGSQPGAENLRRQWARVKWHEIGAIPDRVLKNSARRSGAVLFRVLGYYLRTHLGHASRARTHHHRHKNGPAKLRHPPASGS